MTYTESKAFFEECLWDGKCNEDCPECNAMEVAISAIEKQIPKKPIPTEEQNIRYAMNYVCPHCGKHFIGTGIASYCYHCGQALDWSDTE